MLHVSAIEQSSSDLFCQLSHKMLCTNRDPIVFTFMEIQGPPVNRAIWQRSFPIFSVSGEGERCCQVAWP